MVTLSWLLQTMPSVALVNRCSGWCSTMGHSCMAARTEIRAVTVSTGDVGNG